MSYDYQTSYPAYEEVLQKIGRKQRMVFKAILSLSTCTDKQIASFLSWPINSVTPRRNELAEMELIVSAGIYPDYETGRKVNHWKVKP